MFQYYLIIQIYLPHRAHVHHDFQSLTNTHKLFKNKYKCFVTKHILQSISKCLEQISLSVWYVIWLIMILLNNTQYSKILYQSVTLLRSLIYIFRLWLFLWIFVYQRCHFFSDEIAFLREKLVTETVKPQQQKSSLRLEMDIMKKTLNAEIMSLRMELASKGSCSCQENINSSDVHLNRAERLLAPSGKSLHRFAKLWLQV